MDYTQRMRVAGYCGIVGGLWYFASEWLLTYPQAGTPAFAFNAAVAALDFAVLLIGLMGISWGNALGGWFGKLAFGGAVFGYALMIVGALLMVAGVGPITDPVQAVSLVYLLGRLIAVVCTVLTGIAVILARRWQGWTRFAPLLLGLWPLLGEAGYVVITGNTPISIVNGMWGLWGALLGFATLAQLRSAPAGEQAAAGRA